MATSFELLWLHGMTICEELLSNFCCCCFCFFFTPNATGLRSNDVCDGENNIGEDEFDDEDYMDTLVYRRAVERAVGARDRLVVGLVGEADVPCGEGMVCRRVSRDRRECRDVVEG